MSDKDRRPTNVKVRERQPLWQKICRGEAPWQYNAVCWPFVLVANAVWIYIMPCANVLLMRAYYLMCWPLIMCCYGIYTDPSFDIKTMVCEHEFDWVRASDLATNDKKMKIYEGKIEAKDLVQGAIGDCWLVAALASAAEHPAVVRRAFLTPERNPRGKYRVRIYDGQKKKWVVVTIDDRIPCKKGTKSPLFMKNHGNEMWAILIEKAFAKFCGGYPKLDGGLSVWAWKALTGEVCLETEADAPSLATSPYGVASPPWLCLSPPQRPSRSNAFAQPVFELESKPTKGGGREWRRDDFVHMNDKDDKRKGGFVHSGETYTSDQAWMLIQRYIRARALLAASGVEDSSGNKDGLNGESVDHKGGLVGGHAYSILDARELGFIPGVGFGGGEASGAPPRRLLPRLLPPSAVAAVGRACRPLRLLRALRGPLTVPPALRQACSARRSSSSCATHGVFTRLAPNAAPLACVASDYL